MSANGSYVCFLSVDTAGNSATVASAQVTGIDSDRPTVVINAPEFVVINGTATVEFVITDPSGSAITGFDRDDITVTGSGGTLGATLTENPTNTHTATFTAAGTAGSVVIGVPVHRFQDSVGNLNPAAAPKTITVVTELPSSRPTVALKVPGRDGSLHTQSSTPTFVVTDVANSATVSVAASRNGRTVTKGGTVGGSDTSIEIPFTGSTCDTSDDTDTTADEACTLAEGAWTVTVTHTDSSKDAGVRQVTVVVDNAAPRHRHHQPVYQTGHLQDVQRF